MKKAKILFAYIVLSAFLILGNKVNAGQWVLNNQDLDKISVNDFDVKITYNYNNQHNYTYGGVTMTGAPFSISYTYNGETKGGVAFCTDRNEALPGFHVSLGREKTWNKGKVLSASDSLYNKKLATALYYGYKGPADLTGSLEEGARIAITAFAASYAKNGSGDADQVASGSPVFAQLKAHIDAADCPNNVTYLYIGTYAYDSQDPPTSNAVHGVTCTNYQWLSVFYGYAPMGRITLNKVLDTYDSSYATVSGAKYGVYKDANCTTKVGELVTGPNGKTNTIEVITGTYYIKETEAPEGCRKDENVYTVNVSENATATVTSVEKVKYKMKVKKSLNPINGKYGDAKLKNAVYGIYDSQACTNLVAKLKTNDSGETQVSDFLTYKKYYAKEIEAPEGTILNDTVYELDPSKAQKVGEDYIATFETKNEIIPTSLKVIKYRDDPYSTEESAAKGAILKITLNSNKAESYEAVVDENGKAEFTNIPYGTYTLSESETNSNKYLKIDEEVVEMFNSQTEKTYRLITSDDKFPVYLKVVKVDADTNKTISLEGAKFKIYDVENRKWVQMLKTPSGEYIDEFEVNSEGTFITPQVLYAGEYVLYETDSPKGYYLDPKYCVPENESDLGNTDIAGIKVNITTQLQVQEDEKGNYIYELKVKNKPLKVKLQIHKTGEKLTGSSTVEEGYNTETGREEVEKYVAKYSMVGLADVKYDIVSVNDIKSPDGKVTYVRAGQTVDTIVTNEEGTAYTKDLYPGEYEIKEVQTPKGYIKDENIPNVVLENEDKTVEVKESKKELSDVRQKLELTFKKIFEDVKYSTEESQEKRAVFGIYTKNAVMSYDNKNVVIPANKLVDLIEVTKDDDVTSTIDLPEGAYYAKELYTTYPYTLDTNTQEFVLKYNGKDTQEFVVESGKDVINVPESATLTLIKLSSTTIGNVVLNGDKLENDNLDDEIQKVINDLKGKTEEEIKDYFKENNIKAVGGAKYRLYKDEACTKELLVKNETTGKFEASEIVTDETGIIKLEDLPLGEYWIKEVEAPKGYEVSDEVIKVTLDVSNKNAMVYQALIEESVKSVFITKTDIFTGEVVPNCTFEIKDKEGNTLLRSKTDEKGDAYIPVDLFEDGKIYTYTEIEAPEIYKLNEEPHEFTAKFDKDGNWAVEKIKVENVRKESRVELTKLDMVDSTPIPNCKFELKSLETDFKVEGVTDENGVYVFEDIPYGKYTYTELEAPEEYLIDTTPHEITIDTEDTKIVVKDERAPETGDIAVVVLVIVAVVCVAGIVFVVVKNKKQK